MTFAEETTAQQQLNQPQLPVFTFNNPMLIQSRVAHLKVCWTKEMRKVPPPSHAQFAIWARMHRNGVIRKGIRRLARRYRRLSGEMNAYQRVHYASLIMKDLSKVDQKRRRQRAKRRANSSALRQHSISTTHDPISPSARPETRQMDTGEEFPERREHSPLMLRPQQVINESNACRETGSDCTSPK